MHNPIPTILNKLAVKPSMETWDEIMEFVTSESTKNIFDKKKSYGLTLAAEEIISNIIRASGDRENVSLEISTQKLITNEQKVIFELKIADNGIHFDPKFDSLKNPCLDMPAADRQIGGLGLFLVKTSCDCVAYKYENNFNIYTLSTFLT